MRKPEAVETERHTQLNNAVPTRFLPPRIRPGAPCSAPLQEHELWELMNRTLDDSEQAELGAVSGLYSPVVVPPIIPPSPRLDIDNLVHQVSSIPTRSSCIVPHRPASPTSYIPLDMTMRTCQCPAPISRTSRSYSHFIQLLRYSSRDLPRLFP